MGGWCLPGSWSVFSSARTHVWAEYAKTSRNPKNLKKSKKIQRLWGKSKNPKIYGSRLRVGACLAPGLFFSSARTHVWAEYAKTSRNPKNLKKSKKKSKDYGGNPKIQKFMALGFGLVPA